MLTWKTVREPNLADWQPTPFGRSQKAVHGGVGRCLTSWRIRYKISAENNKSVDLHLALADSQHTAIPPPPSPLEDLLVGYIKSNTLFDRPSYQRNFSQMYAEPAQARLLYVFGLEVRVRVATEDA